YAKTVLGLIDSYSLTDYDIVPLDLVLLSGAKGAKVKALQYLLLGAGVNVKATGTFDAATVSAVKKYQVSKKMDKDGEAGPQTLGSLFASLSPGARGARVRALHALLSGVGQPTTSGDTLGKETVAAVKAVQSAAGQSPTGVANSKTWALLFMTPDQAPAPTVAGSVRVTQTLIATAGKWGPGAFTLTYQWYRGGTPIPGAVEANYILQPADAGQQIVVAVTGARPGYTTITRLSGPTPAVAKAQLITTPTPTITGRATVGELLSAVAGVWSPGPVTLSYQWYRGTKALAGSTTASYTPQAADLNDTLKVVVTGSRPGFDSVTKASGETAAVGAGKLVAKNPSIGGTPKVGKTLTAVPGTWSRPGVSFSYQWYRGSAKIDGATKVAYKLAKADRGKKISVRVRGSLGGYASLEKTSRRARIS
ncbi:MAG TPA: peptidoglycan-binding protein, partial [Propionicimonas sp.]